MASTMTTFMSSGPVLLCTESSIFLASLDLDGLCIAPSIFAKDSGTGIRGYSNTFWRSKSDMALRYNSRPRRSLLPVNSMIFSLSCDLTLLITTSLVNVFSFQTRRCHEISNNAAANCLSDHPSLPCRVRICERGHPGQTWCCISIHLLL